MQYLVEFIAGGFKVTSSADRSGCIVTVRQGTFSVTAKIGKDDKMAYTLALGTQVHVQVKYVDANGNPARVDGEVMWDTSEATLATATPDPADSSQAIVRAGGTTVGQVQINATADADLGDGVRELVCTMDVDVVAGEAVAGVISPAGPSESIT